MTNEYNITNYIVQNVQLFRTHHHGRNVMVEELPHTDWEASQTQSFQRGEEALHARCHFGGESTYCRVLRSANGSTGEQTTVLAMSLSTKSL